MEAGRAIIVVPCYNEAERLRPGAFTSCIDRELDVSFMFVDDGSSDNTAGVLRGLVSDRPDSCNLVSLPENRGKAEAVRHGVLTALEGDPEYLGYWDADLATPLSVVSDFIGIMRHRPAVEIVMGARVRLLGRRIRRRALRHYPGRMFATFASLVLGLPVYDTQCGAKLFRNNVRTRRVFMEPFMAGWIFDVELLARYLALVRAAPEAPEPEAAIYELPLSEWTDVGGSKTRPRDFVRAAWDLARIWWRYRGPAEASPISSANAGDS